MTDFNWVNTAALGILSWCTPTLAVIGTNLPWFSKRQVCGAIALSLLLGLCCGAICCLLADVYASLLCGLSFSLSSERLLHWLFPRGLSKFCAICCILILFGACGHFFGTLPLCVLLGLYAGFSLYDICKKWRLPRKFIPEAPVANTRKIPPVSSSGKELTQAWKIRPNIYFLFLESIHSSRAMQELFAHDDFGLEKFLKENDFVLFPKGHANLIYTRPSLNVLLNMGGCQNCNAMARFLLLHLA